MSFVQLFRLLGGSFFALALSVGWASLRDLVGGVRPDHAPVGIVLTALAGGWEAAYFPALVLHHLIPASRLEPGYLGRLNRAIQHSWVCVLARHQACPWSPVARWTVPLRQARAWWRS